MRKTYLFFTLLLMISLPALCGSWKFSFNSSYQTLDLNELEAIKDFWNIAFKSTAIHKNEQGYNLEIPEEIDGIYYSTGFGLSLEKEFNKLLIKLSADKFHKGYNPAFQLGNLSLSKYEVNNSIRENLDLFSPSLSLSIIFLKGKKIDFSAGISAIFNFLTWKYSSDFSWIVLDQSGVNEIINISETRYTKITKFIPALMPFAESTVKLGKLGLSLTGGYNIGSASDISGYIDYSFSMSSAFHAPITISYNGDAKIWLGESWVELMGLDKNSLLR